MPAYWVTVVAVLLLFPVAGNPGVLAIIANLFLGQIYVSHGLLGGLTHLWSLCVEMAFYLVMPVLAIVFGRRNRAIRVGIIVVLATLSFGWAFIPAFAEAPARGIKPARHATCFHRMVRCGIAFRRVGRDQ